MEIIATKYRREDGVHIVLTKAGWLILAQSGPMRIWTGNEWEVLFNYETEELEKFSYSKFHAMKLLNEIKKPKIGGR